MNYYETMIIVHPNIEEAALTKITDDIKDMITKRGGALVYTEDMGKRKLAYPVEKQRFGTYLLLQFTGDGTGNSRLLLDLEHKDNVLAHMVVRIREQDVREERDDKSESSTDDVLNESAISRSDSKQEPETAPADADESQAASTAEVATEATAEEIVEEAAEEPETDSTAEGGSDDTAEAVAEPAAEEKSEVAEEK